MDVICLFCGDKMQWESDFEYDEIYNEGDGIIRMFHCKKCGASAEYSKREDAV